MDTAKGENSDKYGLDNRCVDTVVSILNEFPSIQVVFIFGSRAKGTYHAGSDIDLAVMNSGLSIIDLARVKGRFEESDLPYFVDLVDYTKIVSQDLREHIDRVGQEFYRRTE